jgi:hypothetical protein
MANEGGDRVKRSRLLPMNDGNGFGPIAKRLQLWADREVDDE